MSQTVLTLVIFVLLGPLWWRLRRDFVSGLAYGVVILISFTHLLRIPTPGILPELSIHRLVLLSLLFFWIQRPELRSRLSRVPLAGTIGVWVGVAFLSMLGSVDHVGGIKRYLDYVLEFFLLYFILATSLRDREDALRILRAACIGLAIVAGLATVEKYSGFNVVDRFIPFGDEESSNVRDVRATYRHRILLGAGMAMGWPLALAMAMKATHPTRKKLAWLALCGMLAACYFSRSRGPWLAAVLAGGVLFLAGTRMIRQRILLLAGLTGLLLVARPGVFGTLSGLTEATFEVDSLKGGTFRYRFELWRVAFHSVAQSPWRFLFGYGPGSGAGQSLEWTLSYRDQDFEITSWDNDFAYSLYQYGFAGLFASLALYAAIPYNLLRASRRVTGRDRDLFVCLGASTLVLFFMMTNVMIFARQLYYLLWVLTAAGFVLKSEFVTVRKRRSESGQDGYGAWLNGSRASVGE